MSSHPGYNKKSTNQTTIMTHTKDICICISRLSVDVTHDQITEVFKLNQIGNVSHVDFVATAEDGNIYRRGYVYFDHINTSPFVDYFFRHAHERSGIRLVTNKCFWLCKEYFGKHNPHASVDQTDVDTRTQSELTYCQTADSQTQTDEHENENGHVSKTSNEWVTGFDSDDTDDGYNYDDYDEERDEDESELLELLEKLDEKREKLEETREKLEDLELSEDFELSDELDLSEELDTEYEDKDEEFDDDDTIRHIYALERTLHFRDDMLTLICIILIMSIYRYIVQFLIPSFLMEPNM